MFTANSMNCLTEVLGLALPGNGTILATHKNRVQLMKDAAALIVKNAFKRFENPCICPPNFPKCVCGRVSKGKVITRKPIIPTDGEIEDNPRSRSAKLRVFERTL